MLNLYQLTKDELQEEMLKHNQKAFRAKQVFSWLYKGVSSFDQMTNLSKDFRNLLSLSYSIAIPRIIEVQHSKKTDTKKYLLALEDNNMIEAVLLSYHHGYSICISTQVGCKMGCTFCASAKLGFVRDLTVDEMIGQIIAIQLNENIRISNVVMMGIGEPLDNFDNVVKMIYLANDKEGLDIGMRHFTISTCGLVDKINELSKLKLPIHLALSLHSGFDDKRQETMPIAKKYSVKETIKAMRNYADTTKRRVTYEYAMLAGQNDSKQDALRIRDLLKGSLAHVNLINVNPIEDGVFHPTDDVNMKLFREVLINAGIEVTIRRRLGSDIDAACGQLRRKRLKDNEV